LLKSLRLDGKKKGAGETRRRPWSISTMAVSVRADQ
jgi:hypothetical protein